MIVCYQLQMFMIRMVDLVALMKHKDKLSQFIHFILICRMF